MPCGIYWQQLRQTESAIKLLQQEGFGPGTAPYQALWARRGKLLVQVGIKAARVQDWLMDWAFYSPTAIRLAHDPEIGFVAVVKERPGAPPVYRSVSDAVARAILRGEVTPELEKELLSQADYYGE